MRRLTVFGWAIGAGILAMFAGMIGAERLRWNIPLWFDGEVIRGVGFWLAVITAPAVGYFADRGHHRMGRTGRVVLLGSGMGLLAATVGLLVATIF